MIGYKNRDENVIDSEIEKENDMIMKYAKANDILLVIKAKLSKREYTPRNYK